MVFQKNLKHFNFKTGKDEFCETNRISEFTNKLAWSEIIVFILLKYKKETWFKTINLLCTGVELM